ncbi:hypothetical protein J3R82DRAFT_7127, partial [Butyriboletus roseoflavus]
VIPSGGSRLSTGIIDYSIAVFVNSPGNKSPGVVGTEEYMVLSGGLRYDFWSCGGRMLE